MRTVEMRLHSNELFGLMAAMRIWLDERRFEPSSFSCHNGGGGVLVRIEFKIADEADAFARQFDGRVDDAVAAQVGQGLVRGIPRTGLPQYGVVG